MAGRYIDSQVVDYCFNPLHVVKDGRDVFVPCGKCDGCLLHKANDWSMRCGMEIEDSPATIFGTLTYNNHYLPKLVQFSDYWLSDNKLNIRYNSVGDVSRTDGIIIRGNYSPSIVQNWDNDSYPVISYASKRDIQLWLKLIRKDLNELNIYKDDRINKNGFLRYYIISEIGPTTLRPHFHFLLFCQSVEVSKALLDGILYKNWKMCDENRFKDYCHLCDSGARGYVTEYLTCFSDLPAVYKENKDIKPFRLASKSPAIGFIGQDKEKIFQDVSSGVIMYTRKVPRLESNPILQYPSTYLDTLFPKCYQFDKIAYRRRYFIYGYLYRAVRRFGYSYFILLERLRQVLKPADFRACYTCWRFCTEIVGSPEYYVYLLDTYYYKKAQEDLRRFYSQMEQDSKVGIPFWKWFLYYPNLYQIVSSTRFNICPTIDFSFVVTRSEILKIKEICNKYMSNYRNEVSDILQDSVKTAKFNELTGVAPTIV